jgi:hypothetical protein
MVYINIYVTSNDLFIKAYLPFSRSFRPCLERRNLKHRNRKKYRNWDVMYLEFLQEAKPQESFKKAVWMYTGIIDIGRWKHEVRSHVSFPPKFLWNSLVYRNFKGILLDSYSFVPNGSIGIFHVGILSYKIPTLFLCFKRGLIDILVPPSFMYIWTRL